ncbi:MAG TPA: MgtC/SapB family protein, partial [Deltaproteobacteria bacterium]|nr:MgtC/SapB family protein [Deltaproteobacteria bacterium]HQQ16031.1 MgtC/SapB family protein [Deltaproteobacteria bacterium]
MGVFLADFWTVIGVSVLCGGIVGLERQIRGKPAGIRTSIFICLGTSLFVSLSIAYANAYTDITRVLGQVVTGIGFLGAGVILCRGDSVLGVTSAAVIWLLAAVGALIGFKEYAEALAVSTLTVMFLIGIGILEHR